MTSVNSWYPEPVEMDGPGLEWGPVQWAKAGTFSDDEHPQLGDNERRFYTIAIRRGWSEETDAASIAVLGVTRDLESGAETRYRADSENWTPVDRDGIPPSVCKRPPRDSNIPVARKAKFRSVLERAHDRGNNPVDTRSDSASELRADGGTRESEQVDRAVREAATLIDAGDSKRVAISYVVDEYDLEHRRDDVHQRVRERLEHKVVADGGHNPEDLVVLGCEPCDYETVVALGTISMTSCPDCQGDLETDPSRVAHQCPESTANHVIIETNERCPFCQTIQKRVATDGGVDQDDEYFVVDESRAAVVAGPFDAKEPAASDARERGPGHIVTTEGSLELIALTSNTSIRWENDDVDIVTDGGREAFLSGDSHWCDLCDRPFSTLGELIRHDCQNQQIRADGGRPEHQATCDDCSWSYRDTDLVDVSDEMERHARKEMHDVDLERAIATDGGNVVNGTERCSCGESAEWTWFTGKGAMGAYCPEHAREELPEESALPAYKDPITTAENVTLLRGQVAIVPGGGVKPIGRVYPVVRSKEALDRYLQEGTDQPALESSTGTKGGDWR
ncbi:hypothetical protein [Halostagnicola sp. A-GB9-2]|uniref:hypothetical protein n=1 Tax=Halostagnicola sp. A-GB9-2 TaxID=3048066 RepID=UPI0024BF1BC6|nr:hypothetical protein [Halostagnicola sp. A-GB9-2]MDJ1433965.1 hypothetical protein [Halostagnicola sp. A-GB9-2]